MAGRVIDMSRAGTSEVFAGEILSVRRLETRPGEVTRIEAAEGEERVLVAMSGAGSYRADAFSGDAPGQTFSPGRVGILRSCGWCEITAEGPESLLMVEVRAPEPSSTRP